VPRPWKAGSLGLRTNTLIAGLPVVGRPTAFGHKRNFKRFLYNARISSRLERQRKMRRLNLLAISNQLNQAFGNLLRQASC